ncbi:MAG: AI-2E family transporter [Terriglobales bacterium]
MEPASATAARRLSNGRGLVVFTVTLLAALALAWYLRTLMLLVYASVLFAILVSPLVEWVEHWHWRHWRPGRGFAIVVVVAGGVVGLVLLLLVLLPPLMSETESLIAAWPQISDRALAAMQRLPGMHGVNVDTLEGYFAAAGGWALGAAQQLASAVADGFTILLLTLYLLVEGHATREWCLRLAPVEKRQRLARTLERGQRRMRGWLLGQTTLALIMGAASAAVFAALRLPDFYVLALLAAGLSFIPLLGPLAALAISGIVAGVQSWASLAGVVAFFAIYETLENAYLTPRIMRNAVDLPGLAIIIALGIGAALGGILGAILSVPSAALAAELLTEYAQHAN